MLTEQPKSLTYCHVYAKEGDYLFPKSFNTAPIPGDCFLHSDELYYVVSRRYAGRGQLQLIVDFEPLS